MKCKMGLPVTSVCITTETIMAANTIYLGVPFIIVRISTKITMTTMTSKTGVPAIVFVMNAV